MTGYTVHTGATEKFVEGWDQIFKSKAKGKSRGKARKPGAKKKSAKRAKRRKLAKSR
jgi:hypothetical protein